MAESYAGQVRGGVVVFDPAAVPPEGTQVMVVPIPRADESALDAESEAVAGTRALLLRWAERAEAIGAELPPDLAENHDHHAHGKPLA